jgi:hypothetical protein
MGRWQKGESGNLLGRPKNPLALSALLEARLPKEEFVRRVIDVAMGHVDGVPFSAQVAALKLIWDRVEGLAIRRSEREGKLTVEVVYTDEGAKSRTDEEVIDLSQPQIEAPTE